MKDEGFGEFIQRHIKESKLPYKKLLPRLKRAGYPLSDSALYSTIAGRILLSRDALEALLAALELPKSELKVGRRLLDEFIENFDFKPYPMTGKILKDIMNDARIKMKDLAAALGTVSQFPSMLTAGLRPIPAEKVEPLIQYLSERGVSERKILRLKRAYVKELIMQVPHLSFLSDSERKAIGKYAAEIIT